MHSNIFDPIALQIFALLQQPIVVAAASLFALWLLIRWGSALFILYALTRACVGEWGQATIAVVFAILIGFGNSFASWLEWNAHGRDAWLRQYRRDRARH